MSLPESWAFWPKHYAISEAGPRGRRLQPPTSRPLSLPSARTSMTMTPPRLQHSARYSFIHLSPVSRRSRKPFAPRMPKQNLDPYITELCCSNIRNINRGYLHTRSFRCMHFSLSKAGQINQKWLYGPQTFRGFLETSPREERRTHRTVTVPKNTTSSIRQPGLEPWRLDPESSALTIIPPHLNRYLMVLR